MFQGGSIGRSRKTDLEARKHENTLNCDDKTESGGQKQRQQSKARAKTRATTSSSTISTRSGHISGKPAGYVGSVNE